LDGILADSEGVSRQVFRTFAAAFGRAAESAEATALDGSPAPILVAKAKRAWGLPQKLDELTRRYDGLMDAALLELPPAPAVAPLFAAASRNGWKLGILAATASARARALSHRAGAIRLLARSSARRRGLARRSALGARRRLAHLRPRADRTRAGGLACAGSSHRRSRRADARIGPRARPRCPNVSSCAGRGARARLRPRS